MSKNTWIVFGIVGSLFLLGGTALLTYPAIVRKFANAIAIAERGQAEINSGNIQNNNPGDISDSNGVISYPTIQDGWNALYHQVSLMFNGGSAYYSSDMTITEIAQRYAENWQNWAHNVSSVLGVSPDTQLNQLS